MNSRCFLYQQVTFSIRKRGLNEIMFTRQKDDIGNIVLLLEIGHVLLEYNFIGASDIINEEEVYKNLLNYKRGNYKELQKYFKGVDWALKLAEVADTQYLKFC